MKKLFLMAVAFGAMVASADSYLYWMIGDTDTHYKGQVTDARIKASNGSSDNYLTIYYSDGTSIGSSVGITDAKAEQNAGLGFYASLGEYYQSGYSYIVELYNGDELLAKSNNSLTYATAGSYLVDSGIGVPGGNVWTATYPIPEPTSGLMVLLGMAALALRRRRRA